MKKTLPSLILFIFINLSFSQGTDILSAEQFCSGNSSLSFNNVYGGTNSTSVGCLFSIPNASYFYLVADQPGDLYFDIDQEDLSSNPIDVDFIAWGPFTDINDANTNISYTDCASCPNNTTNPAFYPYATDYITDCSYDPSPTETMTILNALPGQIYVVLITNYDSAEGIINFQQSGGTGTTTCLNLPVCGNEYFDLGGATGDYAGDETTTITPYFAGGTVTVDFTVVDIPDAGDVLTAYNGPNNSYPILGTVTSLPAIFTSYVAGNPTGAITFDFISDGDTNVGAGWEADITCDPPPAPPTCGETFYDNGGATGNYVANESQVLNIFADTPGDIVTVTFTAFDTESGNDVLAVYNGPNTTYPLIGNYSGTSLPGPFTSTDLSGALTFVFTSNNTIQSSGWAADISCYHPPTCGSIFYDSGGPTEDYISNELETTTFSPDIPGDAVTATFTAFHTEFIDDLYVYDGPDDSYPLLGVFYGTTIPGPFTSTDASGALTFVFDSDGSVEYSGWTASISCAPYTPPLVCGSTFYDSGGSSGNYSDSEDETTTFYPDTPGDYVVATFTAFDTETSYDELTVYNGPNDTFPSLGTFSGSTIPGPLTSTDSSGALTFVFESDYLVNYSGWSANITCFTPICGTTVYDNGGSGGNYSANETETTTYYPETPGDLISITFTAFNTENGIDELSIYDGPDDSYPILGTFSGSTLPGTFTSSDLSTGALTFVFTSNGSVQNSGWAADITCVPPPSCGTTFYDSGGASENYSTNETETSTFFPDNPGDYVVATFTAFNTESGYDYLSVYDGPDETYPLLGEFSGTTTPGPFASSDTSGALTFVFDSDFSGIRSGWAANITCESSCDLIITDTIYPIGADDCTLNYTELTTNATATYTPIYIFSEDFDGPGLPTGWTINNGNGGAWSITNSSYAGGTPYEARLNGGSSTTASGTRTLTTPAIDISGQTDLQLSLKQYLSHYNNSYNYSVAIQTNLDNGGWTNQYRINSVSNNISQETRNIVLRNSDLSALSGTSLRIRFILSGRPFGLSNWYIDDISLTVPGTTTPPQITWSPAEGLYTDVSLSTPYISNTYSEIVYAAPMDTQTYTATDINSCTDTVAIINNKKTWNGSQSTDWYDDDNWTPSGIPTDENCVIIPDLVTSNNNSPIVLGTPPTPPPPAQLRSLNVRDDGYLELQQYANLIVTDAVVIETDGKVILRNGSNLVQITNSGITNSGNIQMQRTVSSLNPQDYVYWSSPVANFNVADVSPGSNSRYNWIPTVPGNGDGNYGDWQATTEVMQPGKGYIIRGVSGTNPETAIATNTVEFRGVPRNGAYQVTIVHGGYSGPDYDGAGNTMATALDDNWNLIGNPYPSGISADAFITQNASILDDTGDINTPTIFGTVYLWRHQSTPSSATDPFYGDYAYNYNANDYIGYNSTGSNPSGFNGNIGAGQAFFVLMDHDAPSPSNVSFNNNMRLNSGIVPIDNNEFYRSTENSSQDVIEKHRIWLDLIAPNNKANSILVGYIDNATNNFDRIYDGFELSGTSNRFYSLIYTEEMAIQGRSTPFNDSDLVPLGIEISSSGNYTIAINTLDGLFNTTNQSIYIEDTYTNTIHNLRVSPYSFSSDAGSYNDRFILRYTVEVLSMSDFELSSLNILAPNHSYIKVMSEQSPIESVIIYDLLGRVLFSKSAITDTEFILKNHNLSDGTYIVKATLIHGRSKSQKIILKN
ncbi:CUB domain-containing protein [Winogradskyella helgolandensis]|uniref:CUB domain-containing protein n=1 Tax=Winogradskyella helgolandensis TaxID=2697010 RepID=UPI0015CE3B29|nr:CUB domain-containing protein [Winogradskyella helgolandensis]